MVGQGSVITLPAIQHPVPITQPPRIMQAVEYLTKNRTGGETIIIGELCSHNALEKEVT